MIFEIEIVSLHFQGNLATTDKVNITK